jgi:WD40 repeat protein
VAQREPRLGELKAVCVLAAALVTALVAVVASGDEVAAAGRAGGYRILLASNRDGRFQGYSVRADGSRLTPLLARGRKLLPSATSADGRLVAYTSTDFPRNVSIYVSRASGAGLRRIGAGSEPALSSDGRLLAYAFGNGITIVGTNGRGRRQIRTPTGEVPNWSPDAKALVFAEQIHEDPDRYSVVLKPLRARRRVLFRTGPADAGCVTATLQPTWSPDGRWVAYLNCEDDPRRDGVWVVRPDGTHRHRVSRSDVFAWSPDGRRLAYTSEGGVGIVAADGRGRRRLSLPRLDVRSLTWAPGGRGLILAAQEGEDDPQIWVVGLGGRGLRRVTGSGRNELVGWTRLRPVRPPAAPLPPTVRVVGREALAVRSPVADLAADGGRVALVAGPTATDCEHVSVWTPAARSIRRFSLPSPCPDPRFVLQGVSDVALAGSRVAWAGYSGGPGDCEFTLETATLALPVPLLLNRWARGECRPFWDFYVRGDGNLLVFDDNSRDRLVRIGGGRERCEEPRTLRTAGICTTLRRGADVAPVESVSGGLIAISKPDAVTVLDERGNLVRTIAFPSGDVTAARLDARLLVVARSGTLETYDVATGSLELSRPLPNGFALSDVDGGIAVLLRDATIMLLRLEDGRSSTLAPGAGPVLADLEPPGLYYTFPTGGDSARVVFLPRSNLPRQFRGGTRPGRVGGG